MKSDENDELRRQARKALEILHEQRPELLKAKFDQADADLYEKALWAPPSPEELRTIQLGEAQK